MPVISIPAFVDTIIASLKSNDHRKRVEQYAKQFQSKVMEFSVDDTLIRIYVEENLLFTFNHVIGDTKFNEYELTPEQTKKITSAFFNE